MMVCLDTSPVIWGVQQDAKDHQRPMIKRMRRYLKHCAEHNIQLMVPVPVMEGVSGRLPDLGASQTATEIGGTFFSSCIDVHAGMIAAEIESNRERAKAILASGTVDRPFFVEN